MYIHNIYYIPIYAMYRDPAATRKLYFRMICITTMLYAYLRVPHVQKFTPLLDSTRPSLPILIAQSLRWLTMRSYELHKSTSVLLFSRRP